MIPELSILEKYSNDLQEYIDESVMTKYKGIK